MEYHLPEGWGVAAHPRDRRRNGVSRPRLRLKSAGRTIDVVEAWADGFSIDSNGPQPQRGIVDLFDGARHIRHGLIYQTGADEAHVTFAFKSAHDPRMAQPCDFARAEDGPVALIGRD